MASENPARTLQGPLAPMRFRVEPGRFALLGSPEPPAAEDLVAQRLLERTSAVLELFPR